MSDALARLYATIVSRKGSDPKSSYTAKLLSEGAEKIAAKITEEAGETVAEILKNDKARLASESADLLYHLLVAWAAAGLKPDDVWAVLEKREGTSGIEEKNSRPK
jgi:phosphoribosyl-ATP pyrophosphohydrolase